MLSLYLHKWCANLVTDKDAGKQPAGDPEKNGVRIEDKIKIAEIRKRTGMKDILERVGLTEIKYAGHIARLNTDSWANQLGTLRQQKEERKTNNEMEAKYGVLSGREAQNRDIWRRLGEAYARKLASG